MLVLQDKLLPLQHVYATQQVPRRCSCHRHQFVQLQADEQTQRLATLLHAYNDVVCCVARST